MVYMILLCQCSLRWCPFTCGSLPLFNSHLLNILHFSHWVELYLTWRGDSDQVLSNLSKELAVNTNNKYLVHSRSQGPWTSVATLCTLDVEPVTDYVMPWRTQFPPRIVLHSKQGDCAIHKKLNSEECALSSRTRTRLSTMDTPGS